MAARSRADLVQNGPRRLGRDERRPVSRHQRAFERRREISARQQQPPARLLHPSIAGPRPGPVRSGLRASNPRTSTPTRIRTLRRTAARSARADLASFTPISASVGANYEFATGWRAGLSLSHSERAPAIDELFANGPHGGSETFEVGDPTLGKESSNAIELSLHRTTGPVHVQGSLYYSRFSNFIFQAPTGAVARRLAGLLLSRGQGELLRVRAAGRRALRPGARNRLGRRARDRRRPSDDQGLRPRTADPPLRVIGALTGSRGQVDGRLEIERDFAHDRTAPIETSTPGFTLVNASLDWHPFAANPELTFRSRATICSMSTPGGAPASSRITRRSPAATSA